MGRGVAVAVTGELSNAEPSAVCIMRTLLLGPAPPRPVWHPPAPPTANLQDIVRLPLFLESHLICYVLLELPAQTPSPRCKDKGYWAAKIRVVFIAAFVKSSKNMKISD